MCLNTLRENDKKPIKRKNIELKSLISKYNIINIISKDRPVRPFDSKDAIVVMLLVG